MSWWLDAYSCGLFPMAAGIGGPIQLWTSRSRALMPLDQRFRVPKSVRRWLGRQDHTFSLNGAFSAVLHACAERPERWISDELIRVYLTLHSAGWAHSVEVWEGDQLAAGMLAIGIGACWIGESMVHHRAHAGNVMLVRLVEALGSHGFQLFDVQVSNPHLERFGCQRVSERDYADLLCTARTRATSLRLGSSQLRCEGWMRE